MNTTKNPDRWAHEVFLPEPSMMDRIVVRRKGDKIEHNVPHTLQHESSFGYNIGPVGVRGQSDLALNIAHHLIRKHGLQRLLGSDTIRTACGRKTWQTAAVVSTYIRWAFLMGDADEVDLSTKEVLKLIKSITHSIKKFEAARAKSQEAAVK